jgi:hypothetical protein
MLTCFGCLCRTQTASQEFERRYSAALRTETEPHGESFSANSIAKQTALSETYDGGVSSSARWMLCGAHD